MRLNKFILKAVAFLFCAAEIVGLSGCQKTRSREGRQVLKLNLYCEPPTLDPRKATDSTSINTINALFEGLIRVDQHRQPQLALAESVKTSHDGLTYLFKLRRAYWTNGDPISANDFVYAWQKVLDPQFPAPFAYKLFAIQNGELVKEGKKPFSSLGIKALNDRTLEIKLQHPLPYFLELLSFPTFFPVPQKVVEGNPEWSTADTAFVSNGPFRLSTWDHENELVLNKNPSYWDADHVFLETIHFTMIDDEMTELYMFEQGELDWAGSPLSNLPVESIGPLRQSGELHSYPISAVYYYKINTTLPPLNNKNIRRALGLAIHRASIVEHILQGGQQVATALIPPLVNWEIQQYFQDGDLSEASKAFEQGLKELAIERADFPVLKLSYNSNKEHQKIAQAIQHQWENALSIHVELDSVDWKSHLSRLSHKDYQIGKSGWIADFSDPISFLEPFLKGDAKEVGGPNETGWENPVYQSLLIASKYESSLERREFLLKRAEEFLIEEMPIIPLYYIVFSYVKNPYVKNVYLSPLGVVDYKWAWIESPKS